MSTITGRLVAASALVALSVTGCGGTDTNGLEKKSAAEVVQAAAFAFKASHSVHVVGTGTSDGRPTQLDLHIQDGSSSGTITIGGARVEITTIGRDAYLRGDQKGLLAVGAPAEAARLGADRWLKFSQQAIGMEGFTLDSFAAGLPSPDKLNPGVEQTELDGQKVVVVSEKDGAKLYVANTGVAYPLRAEKTAPDAGLLNFTEYGGDFHIAAPPGAVEANELIWLDRVDKLSAKMEKIFVESPTDLTPAAMTLMGNQLRSCRRDLAQIPVPSVRLQPAHALVKQACDEYDKGAQCFTVAARIGIPFAGSAAERKQSQALDCGFGASENGAIPLVDALNQATEILS